MRKKLHNYIKNNGLEMRYDVFLTRDRDLGSGAGEGAGKRPKQAGMTWSRQGSAALQALRTPADEKKPKITCLSFESGHNTGFPVVGKRSGNVYAIIEDGGKQYKVEPGTVLSVETRDLAEGQKELEFDKVLFFRDEAGVVVGQPVIAGAKVVGKINGEATGPKLLSMQFRRRKNSRRRVGHRQKYLDVEIVKISK
jgi:large subunit ribosomal protein L21